jgi:ABC-type Fe3+/spermidine/putrescine transport system ATPase subunit
MRLGETERIIAPVASGAKTGEELRVAVRPERVRIGLADSAASDSGSRVEGTIAEIVYLGMYTQFHVDTAAGRIVCHSLAGEAPSTLESQSRVLLSWEPEHTSVLADTPALAPV